MHNLRSIERRMLDKLELICYIFFGTLGYAEL